MTYQCKACGKTSDESERLVCSCRVFGEDREDLEYLTSRGWMVSKPRISGYAAYRRLPTSKVSVDIYGDDMHSLRVFAEDMDMREQLAGYEIPRTDPAWFTLQRNKDIQYLSDHGWEWKGPHRSKDSTYTAWRMFGDRPKLKVVRKDKDFHSLCEQAKAFDALEASTSSMFRSEKPRCLTFQVTDDGSVNKNRRRFPAGMWKRMFKDSGCKVMDVGNGKIWVDVPEDYLNLQVSLPPMFEQDFVTISIPAKSKPPERGCLTNDQIARLRELNAQRTQGTWYAHYTDDGSCMNARYVGTRKPQRDYHDGKAGMDFYSPDKEPSEDVIAITLLQEPRMADNLKFDENMNFIVEAANLMDALLDELESWRGLKDE